MGRTSLPLFQINQYQNRNQNKAVSGLKGVFRLGAAFYNLLFLCAFHSPIGSVKNFVALVKNSSFLVRITDMTILIEKEFIYGSSKRPNPTDYYRK